MIETIDECLDMYIEKFNDGFPMFQIGRTIPKEKVIEIIKECLKQGKDAYELGYVTDDLDVLY